MKESRARSIAHLLNQIIFTSLLVIIAATAIPFGTVQPWWISVFECAVFLVAILAVIESVITRSWSAADLSPFAPLLVLVLYSVVQSLFLFSGPGPLYPRTSLSADPHGTREFAIRLFALILVAVLLFRNVSNRSRLRKVIFVVVGIGVASALFGILRKSFPASFLPGLPIGERGFGQFVNRNHFALMVEMSLGLVLGLIASQVRHRPKVLLWLPICGFLWVALIYSGSRGGILASLCEFLFLGLILDPIRHFAKPETGGKWSRLQNFAGGMLVRGFLIVCLVGLFAYGVSWVGGEPVVSNLQMATNDFSEQEMSDNTNASRKEIWSATWRLIKAHPIAGVGFGGYWIGITKYHDASGELVPRQAHNDYLDLMASGGLIGVALVAWFAVVFLKRARRRLTSPDAYNRAACLGALTGIFGVCVHNFVDFGLQITINALLFLVLVTIAMLSDGARADTAKAEIEAT